MSFPVPRAPKRTPLTVSLSVASLQAVPAPPTIVEEVSAGGVIVDRSTGGTRVAIIARLNRGGRVEWCLPKGHPEGEETHQEAAVREVEEETGIQGNIVTMLGSIDYWFSVSGHRIHKTVHHFLLEATGGELTIENDPDHEAIDVAWVPIAELAGRLTFPNERRIVELAKSKLQHLPPRSA
ncbi:NUDIX hydrolase [Haematomicrobium sanguinis]|uniref:NUDIX hydrolase n=1 Tax=Haematomicrobium sanguinis TaxID=479106 RepID=UPI0006912DC7|nr:NUDIX hydrolase [Haematomicrobium sanguinis]